MTGTARARCLIVIGMMLTSLAIAGAAQAPPPAIEALIASVLDARSTTGFRVRAKLTRTSGDRPHPEVSRPLLITGRRDGRHTTVVYEEIGSKGQPGRALLIEDRGDHQPVGTRFENGTTTPLVAAGMTAPFFDSDLRIEDVFESFWYWRTRAIVGKETIDKRAAVIVEFRPDPGAATRYTRVRAWIAPALALPLRIEQFGANDALEKRITAGRIVKRDERWSAARLTIEPAGSERRTVLEGSRFERDLNLPASEFTAEAIARRLRARD